jgi:hypothetical protein
MLLYLEIHKLTVASIPAHSLTTEATLLMYGASQNWMGRDGTDSRYNGFVWDAFGYQPLISLLFLVLLRPVDVRSVAESGLCALVSIGSKAVVMLGEFLVGSFKVISNSFYFHGLFHSGSFSAFICWQHK